MSTKIELDFAELVATECALLEYYRQKRANGIHRDDIHLIRGRVRAEKEDSSIVEVRVLRKLLPEKYASHYPKVGDEVFTAYSSDAVVLGFGTDEFRDIAAVRFADGSVGAIKVSLLTVIS